MNRFSTRADILFYRGSSVFVQEQIFGGKLIQHSTARYVLYYSKKNLVIFSACQTASWLRALSKGHVLLTLKGVT